MQLLFATETRRLPIAIAATVLGCIAFSHQSEGRVVTAGVGGDAPTVAEAVDLSQDGDTVLVYEGIFREPTIVVDRRIALIGTPGAILDGEGERALIVVTASGVVVSGFEFRNVGVSFVEDRAAVRVDGGHGCLVKDNSFNDTFFAIYLARTAGCTISNNVITGRGQRQTSSGNGIHAWYSKDLHIYDNRIEHQRDGIYLEFVEDADVARNTSVGNLRYGLHFMFSDRCRYADNTFRYNNAGVAVMYTKKVEMVGNRFEHNWGSSSYGLLLKEIDDSRVAGNTFVDNTIGIHAEGANRIEVIDNDFRENGWAVKLMANSVDNTFAGNNFVGNTFDVATNSTRSYSKFVGNYWDRYEGYDLDRDGIGDVPFRPVRLFSIVVERDEPALILLRSFMVEILDTLERVLPVLTPETLVDDAPKMRPMERYARVTVLDARS